MRSWFFVLLFLVLSLVGLRENSALAVQGCLSGGCHHKLTEVRYLHGPLAAEMAGGKGCVVCHQPIGASCTATRAGRFQTRSKGICTTCHGKVAGRHHAQPDVESKCLACHNPHGSDTSPQMLRSKKG